MTFWNPPPYYVKGAPHVQAFPPAVIPEIAFWGRSNVGKSSLLNALLGQKMARVSKNPGCTQMLHFYHIPPMVMLVDLPGYGYANVPQRVKSQWTNLVPVYLTTRPCLRKIYVLMDSRYPFLPADQEALKKINAVRIPVHILFTKSDRLSQRERQDREQVYGAQGKNIAFSFVSAKHREGIDILYDHIGSFFLHKESDQNKGV